MTILVPTDFSKLSKVAVLYAVRVAKKLKADIILLAVINMNTSSASSIQWNKLEDELIKIADQDAEQMIREVKEQIKGKVKITYRYITGYPVEDMVETFATDNGIDLIIMGTKGASGLKKVVLGSNATAVINNSSRPVIAVPGETEYKQIKKIVYATDMDNLNEEIKTVAQLASLFNATVKVLHVIHGDSGKKLNRKKITDDLIKLTKYPKISFHVSKSNSIAEEVDKFVIDQKANLLAMFTHHLDFYEKLFGRSITHQLVFHARVPLLTFNRTTLL